MMEKIDKKINTIECLIPGLKYPVEIPIKKLPVCSKCKKIFKTRQSCRVKQGHTDIPWCTCYICIIPDSSCFTFDEMGNQCLVKEDGLDAHKFIAVPEECPPVKRYRAEGLNCFGNKTHPICMSCKDKNYSRSHCRIKHQHKHLPWGTSYINLMAKRIHNNISSGTQNEENDDELKQSRKREGLCGLKRIAGKCFESSIFSDVDSSILKRVKKDEDSIKGDTPILKEVGVDDNSSRRGICTSTEASKYDGIAPKSSYITDLVASEAFLLIIENKQSFLQSLRINEEELIKSTDVPDFPQSHLNEMSDVKSTTVQYCSPSTSEDKELSLIKFEQDNNTALQPLPYDEYTDFQSCDDGTKQFEPPPGTYTNQHNYQEQPPVACPHYGEWLHYGSPRDNPYERNVQRNDNTYYSSHCYNADHTPDLQTIMYEDQESYVPWPRTHY